MILPTTSLAVSLFASAMVWLGVRVVNARRAAGRGLGHEGDDALTRAVRAQGNLLEYSVPFLALLALCEANGVTPFLTVPVLVLFAAARAAHAYGLLVAEPTGAGPSRMRWRVRGMATTFGAILILIALLGLSAIGAF